MSELKEAPESQGEEVAKKATKKKAKPKTIKNAEAKEHTPELQRGRTFRVSLDGHDQYLAPEVIKIAARRGQSVKLPEGSPFQFPKEIIETCKSCG